MVADEFSAPGKRPDYPIVVLFCVRNLARPHPSSEQVKILRKGKDLS
jgi:hypothetical protein